MKPFWLKITHDPETEKLLPLAHEQPRTSLQSRRTSRSIVTAVLTGLAVLLVCSIYTYQFCQPQELRILALGDSITYGGGSSDSSGYRGRLYQALVANRTNVNFIGELHTGNFTGNAHEGHSGFRIQGVTDSATVEISLQRKPNLVLLHAGTNDMWRPEAPTEDAPERLGALIDRVIGINPDATVIVAQIISSNFPTINEHIAEYNAAIPSLVAERVKLGFKIALVDMSEIGRNGLGLGDGIHPNDMGYNAMAHKWYLAIADAQAKGWISRAR